MKLIGAERTKFAPHIFPDRVAKFFRQPGWFEARECQMRREWPLFPRDAKFFRGTVDICRQSFQIRRSLDARPENARMLIVGKEAETAKTERDGLIEARPGQSASNGREFCFRHFTNEFERHVKILRTHP